MTSPRGLTRDPGTVKRTSNTNIGPAAGRGRTNVRDTTTLFFPTAGKGVGKVKPNPGTTLPERKAGNVAPDKTFKFNLPPHRWSLPTTPREVDEASGSVKVTGGKVETIHKDPALNPYYYGRPSQLASQESGTIGARSIERSASFHGMRRGRLWFFDTNSAITLLDTDEKTGATSVISGQREVSGTQSLPDIQDIQKATLSPQDRKYGFQFLWNPESIAISVDVNLEVTPSIKDRLRSVSGVFPSMEYINLSIMLDRTNDFACLRAKDIKTQAKQLLEFYKEGQFPEQNTEESVLIEKLEELEALGTAHDIEYLFRTVNGGGTGAGPWTNLLGRKTADIGFLQPTLLALQLGPTGQSLSYVGWVNSLNINHVAFNQSMVPIRTQVALGIRCFTGQQVVGF